MTEETKMDSELSKAVATILHHQVRKTLMSDFQLTRESVRQEARSIVQDAVDKKINELISSGAIGRMVGDALAKYNLASMIDKEIKYSVGKLVHDSLQISFNKE
jgi:hypothetical protein